MTWIEPLDYIAALTESGSVDLSHLVFLYSAIRTSYSGRYSYIAYDPVETIQSQDFEALRGKLSNRGERFGNGWFGYLGYGLKECLEQVAHDTPGWYKLPNLTMTRFANVIRFDHDKKIIELCAGKYPDAVYDKKSANESLPSAVSLSSNMTKASYLEKVAAIRERINEGEFYQANLTRKFIGNFNGLIDPLALYRKLCTASPAAYSAFLKIGDTYILSSSPELFLAVDEASNIRTRPVKGTSPRFADSQRDHESLEKLATSAKDRAENLMIVDLMRNDLSRSCIPGSVITEKLFEITSHANVHHMSSTITGKIDANHSTLDAIALCFPPGSMTGAPKIRAMNVCSEFEGVERGIYSGAIGWLGGDGACELSVVIRTLIIRGNQFEFQVGGAITADSDPEQEWQETIDKAKGIALALGLKTEDLLF